MNFNLRELIQYFAESDYSQFEVSSGDHSIALKRSINGSNPNQEYDVSTDQIESIEASDAIVETKSQGLIQIKANRVGQFFPTVELGSSVARGEVLGHIKAMNIMNELRCENRGVVSKMIAQNGEGVAYDELLLELTGEQNEV